MRLVSQYRNFEGPTLQKHREMVLADGQHQVLEQGYSASPFVFGDLTEWERKQALDHWSNNMRGLGQNEEPLWRFSSYDTLVAAEQHEWTPEMRVKFEQVLRTSPSNGVDYIIIDKPLVPKPWPKYDDLTVVGRRTIDIVCKEITDRVSDLGLDVESVKIYERENLNRPEVLAALAGLQTVEDPTEEIIEA